MEGWCVEGWCVEGWCVEGCVNHVKNSHSTYSEVINDYQVVAPPHRGVPGYDWLWSRSD